MAYSKTAAAAAGYVPCADCILDTLSTEEKETLLVKESAHAAELAVLHAQIASLESELATADEVIASQDAALAQAITAASDQPNISELRAQNRRATTLVPITTETALASNVYYAPLSGLKYHRVRDCRGLRNAETISSMTITQAEQYGYTPCSICAGGP